MKKYKRFLLLLLSCALMVTAMPAPAAAVSVTGFPDVPAGIWYEQYLGQIMDAQRLVGEMNIISGLYNKKGELVFEPAREVKRGEWLKMLFEAAASAGEPISEKTDAMQTAAHWSGKYYTKAQSDNILFPDINSMLTDNDKLGGTGQNLSQQIEPLFPCTKEALEQPISRYEMAVILNNVCTNISMQKTVIVEEPAAHITDYAVIPAEYVTAVEQSYGKGLLLGDQTGTFRGADTLTRAEAVTVLWRYLFQDTIKGDGLQEWASYPEVVTTKYLPKEESFANWLRQGHIDAWGNLDAEARIKLFGDPSKTCFYSSYEAADHMVTVSVPIWKVDPNDPTGKGRISSAASITVNKVVAEEVKSIFQMIYDDPWHEEESEKEKFPIYGGWSAGGARFTDTMRHSWGCAIDINAYYNCECNTKAGYLRVTCGYGWWPIGHADSSYAGSMTGPSCYSIGKNENEYGYSVVKAFAYYGWGWGGNGWSNGRSFDYMHFSVLPSGG